MASGLDLQTNAEVRRASRPVGRRGFTSTVASRPSALERRRTRLSGVGLAAPQALQVDTPRPPGSLCARASLGAASACRASPRATRPTVRWIRDAQRACDRHAGAQLQFTSNPGQVPRCPADTPRRRRTRSHDGRCGRAGLLRRAGVGRAAGVGVARASPGSRACRHVRAAVVSGYRSVRRPASALEISCRSRLGVGASGCGWPRTMCGVIASTSSVREVAVGLVAEQAAEHRDVAQPGKRAALLRSRC